MNNQITVITLLCILFSPIKGHFLGDFYNNNIHPLFNLFTKEPKVSNSTTNPKVENPSGTFNIDFIGNNTIFKVSRKTFTESITIIPPVNSTFRWSNDNFETELPSAQAGELSYTKYPSNAPDLKCKYYLHVENYQEKSRKIIINFSPFYHDTIQQAVYKINCDTFFTKNRNSYLEISVPSLPFITSPSKDNTRADTSIESLIELDRIASIKVYKVTQSKNKALFFSIPHNNNDTEYEYALLNPSTQHTVTITELPQSANHRIFKVEYPNPQEQFTYSIQLKKIGLFVDKPWNIIKDNPIVISTVEVKVEA